MQLLCQSGIVLLIGILILVELEVLGIEVDLGVPSIQLLRPLRLATSKQNTEIIGSEGDRFALECSASYPVQWSYSGTGAPEYSGSTASVTKQVNGESIIAYKAELQIGIAKEMHTGQYVCASSEFPALFAYYHVYIPGSALFVASTGKNLLFSERDSSIEIPCTVSQKDAKVSLKKSVAGVLQGAVQLGESYDPKIGFWFNAQNADPSGTYVCTASYGNLYRLIEYTVTPRDVSLRTNTSTCTPSPCGLNTECHLINSKPICKCAEGFLGDPYKSCRKSCPNGNLDCSPAFYCDQTTGTCQNPCSKYECDPNVAECTVTAHRPRCITKSQGLAVPCGRSSRNCGPGSKCAIIQGQPTCVCANGQPPQNPEVTCTASCQRDSDCPLARACDYPNCVNTCEKFNPCGSNATCRMYRHTSTCDCRAGYAGDPLRGCQPIQFEVKPNIKHPSNPCDVVSCGTHARCTAVSRRPICVCEAGYSGQPPDCVNRTSACDSHASCPNDRVCSNGSCWDPCGEAGTCGIDAICTVKYHSVVCSCAKGFSGDPLEQCMDTRIASTPIPFAPRCPFKSCSRNSTKRTGPSSKRTPAPSRTDVLIFS